MNRLGPEQATLHGDFDRDRPPVLTVNRGESVTFSTLDVAWGRENHNAEGGPRAKFEPRSPGPCLVGPVALRGARAGQVLSLHLEEVRPGPWGWTMAGGEAFFNTRLNQSLQVLDEVAVLRWKLEDGWAHSHLGHRVKMQPFPGMLGMPENVPGSQSGWTPRVTGGNLDCRYLQAGNTLYLPIEVDGGLLSCGDGHARQGDGECGGTAIECPMEAVKMRLDVVDLPVRQPIVQTARGWVVLGLGNTLEEANAHALSGMLDWMAPRLHMSRSQTLALAGVLCHLQITQLVNGVVGVQAVWEEDA